MSKDPSTYVHAETYAERPAEAPGPQPPDRDDVETHVRKRREHDAAERMRKQCHGADEVPR